MRISYVFAGLPVSSRDRAIAWYERLLGRPPDMLLNEIEAVWQLADTVSVYVVEDVERIGGGTLTLVVDDLRAALTEITGRGIVTGAIEEVGDAGWKARLTDPEGNAVSIIEVVGATDSQGR